MMKAVLWTRYGSPDGLKLGEAIKPIPRENELLVKVRAATVTAGDSELRSMQFASFIGLPMRLYVGVRKPSRITILGQELSGDVEGVGSGVTRFKPGDAVVVATLFRMGAYAEYVTTSETSPVMLKPGNMTYEEAATIPTGGLNAIHFVKMAALKPGDHVLINGSAGSIGTYAIQIAKAYGAQVTAVDSADKLDMLLSIGADHVIDYARQDYTATGRAYDAIIDIVGKGSFSGSLRSLTPDGRLVLGVVSPTKALRGQMATLRSNKRVIMSTAGYQAEDQTQLLELIESGKVRAIIDRRYSLAQTAEAHRYVDSGRKAGNVVISIGDSPQPFG